MRPAPTARMPVRVAAAAERAIQRR